MRRHFIITTFIIIVLSIALGCPVVLLSEVQQGSLTKQPEVTQTVRSTHALPVFPSSVPDDVYWDNRFSLPGPDEPVSSIVVSGNDIYVAGIFSRIGGLAASQIAKWDGAKWSPLGDGLIYGVTAIAVSGNTVYAATSNQLYAWNGHTWGIVGGGVSGVNAIAMSGSDLYVGGSFSVAGGISANGIAKWNGMNWSSLGSGMTQQVRAITVAGSDVYAGGDFTTAGGVSAKGIARWDGASWHSLGGGITDCSNNCSPRVNSIAVSGSDVYAGGLFDTAGGISSRAIAKWNGASWSPLGSGVTGFVYSMTISAGDLYVGGRFSTAGGIAANNIAKWDGNNWVPLDGGVAEDGLPQVATVSATAVRGSRLYVGGDFNQAGSLNARFLAQWDGSSWSRFSDDEVSNGLSANVHAVAVSGNDVYAGGAFKIAGTVNASRIAKWDGSSWSPLGSGLNDAAFALATSGSDLYAGGPFTMAGSVSAGYIAKWDGSNWFALGSGMNSAVNIIAVNGSDVFAGGTFTTAGGVTANHLARWDGSSWSAVGGGSSFDFGAQVYALAVQGNDIYVGGIFEQVDGVTVKNIAKWDGIKWSALGSGLPGGVYAIAIDGNNVYAGGPFNQAGGAPANLIARWDGNTWSPLGGGFGGCGSDVSFCTPAVNSIKTDNGTLYAAGHFTFAGGTNANMIASWDGNTWFPLGSGIYPGFDLPDHVFGMAISGSDVYLGGFIVRAGAYPSSNFAHWNGCALSLSLASAAFSADGGNGSVDVTSQTGCPWTVNSNSNWIAITSPPATTFTYSVSANTTDHIRIGTITVGNKTFTVYQAPQINDVPPSHPFYLEISKLYARGITRGCGNRFFCPEDSVTREQMAALLIRALGEFNPPEPIDQRFGDVPKENPFYAFIDRLAELGITLGCQPGNPPLYCPSDPVKREQMSAFIIRSLGEFNPPTPGAQRFGDVPPDNQFYNFIDRLAVLQITLGCQPGNPPLFCPDDNVTRGQMAAFLVRAFNL